MPLHLLVKWEVVSPNSRYRDSENLYPIYPLFPCSDFVSQMWGWFGEGGGVMFFLHFMLFPTFPEKNHSGKKTTIFHLMLSLCFLAPPAERQRSFSNGDLSVVRPSVRPSVCPSVKIEGGGGGGGLSQKSFSDFSSFFGMKLLLGDINHILKDRFG